ncbi:FkbM family methyltransferase [Bacteroidota bacterium]|nr:FkbM family methyltransferase [Bacteroidota bacterium]
MKKSIKILLNSLGNLLHKVLNLPILVFISDSFLTAKVNNKSSIKVDGETIYFATPNFLNRYRHKTFFTKEPETLKWIDNFEKKDIFYDIGANVGLYSIYAAKKRKVKVYCFEPSFFNLEFLARNIYMNSLFDDIFIFPIALNENISVSKFRLTSTEWGGALSTFDKNFDDSGNKINSNFIYNTVGFDIDNLTELTKIPYPDHIKIDVDGLEHIILLGAQKVIKRAKTVLIEINDNFTEQKSLSEKLMLDAGFKVVNKVHTESLKQPTFNQFWINTQV